MALRIGVGALVTSLVLMIWGLVFWNVLTVPEEVVQPLPGGEKLAQTIADSVPASGVYVWPAIDPSAVKDRAEARKQFDSQSRKGPLLHLFYTREGATPHSITTLARGLLQFFVAAVLAGYLLVLAQGRLKSFVARAGFVFLAGVFATTLVNLGRPVWLNHPWGYHWLMAVYDASNALVMGVVLAWLLNPHDERYWSLDGK